MRGPHIDSLDGWRGLAIGSLLIGHFFPVPGINLGSVGVNLFFVLSGWLMTRLLFLQGTAIRTFYRRRISRVFPTHFFFIAAIVALFMGLGLPVDPLETAASAMFFRNYLPSSDAAALPFGHLWSLCVEEHSYVLLSFVAIIQRRRGIDPARALAALACICAIFMIWYWTHYSGPELDFGKWQRTEVAAYGIFVSGFLLLRFDARGLPRLPGWMCPLLVVLGIGLHWWSIADPVRTIAGVGAFALAINLLPGAPPALQSALAIRPLRQLGLWSFSIYVWQQPFYLYGEKLGMSPALALLAAIVAGMASFYLLERPARRYLNRVWGKEIEAAALPAGILPDLP
jgi:peptidoglycan/LPS O-acetylase OafA/YrhL